MREVKRIKARVEAERLPQGADPARHLKLGRGSLSDVEWFVQLLQLQLEEYGRKTSMFSLLRFIYPNKKTNMTHVNQTH